MASPWNIDRGDKIQLVFRDFPKVMTDKGPLWDMLPAEYRDMVKSKDGSDDVLVVRSRHNTPQGNVVEIDWRICVKDLLMVGTEGRVQVVARGPAPPQPKIELAQR